MESYCSSELIHLNSIDTKTTQSKETMLIVHTQRKAKHATSEEKTNLEMKKLQWRWKSDGCSVFVRPSSSVMCLHLLIASFFILHLRHSLYWFLHFLFLFLQILFAEKLSKDAFFLSFFFCPSPVLSFFFLGQQPRLLYILYMDLLGKQILY